MQVIIQLASFYNGKWIILWNNPFVNSPSSVRPVSLELKRENDHAPIVKERLLKELEALQNTVLSSDHVVRFHAFMALCDQKALDEFLGSEGSSNCPLCGATPTQMSDKNFVCKPIKPKAKDFYTSLVGLVADLLKVRRRALGPDDRGARLH